MKNGAGTALKAVNGSGKGSFKKNEKDIGSSFKSLSSLALFVAGAGVLWNVYNAAPYTKVVQTTAGPVRGEELIFEDISYKAFKGIPYAAPPVGNLRFKPPEPPHKWTEVRDTRSYGNICHQPPWASDLPQISYMTTIWNLVFNTRKTIQSVVRLMTPSEDCLTVNVFTPSLGENGSKPVLVYIHGGGFYCGDGTDALYGPQYLLEQDIVVVTFNYRLGPLGFLATGRPEATGNQGMKDQVALLKWVQANIANFGGDPEQVTLYGESAGAASAHLHLFSPLSKGLFHKVIPSSGTALNYWGVFLKGQDKYSQNLARLLGASQSEIDDPVKRVDFLMTADPSKMSDLIVDLVDIGYEPAPKVLYMPLPFSPVLEPPGTKGAFLTEEPRKLIKEGKFAKVPMMVGANGIEGGILFIAHSKNASRETLNHAVDIAENDICVLLHQALIDGITAKGDCAKVSQKIRDVYFDGKSFHSSFSKFIEFYSDLIVVAEMNLAERYHAIFATEEAPLYNYFFNFDGKWNFFKHMFSTTELPGAFHGDDLSYVYEHNLMRLPSLETPLKEIKTRRRMVSFITNFVKHGNPTPSVSDLIPVKWEPSTKNEYNTMYITDDLKLEKDFRKKQMDFWDELYRQYTGSPLFP